MATYHLKKLKAAHALSIGSVLSASAAWEVVEIKGLRLGGIQWKAQHKESADSGWRVFTLEETPACLLACRIAEQLQGQVFPTRGQALEAIEAAALIVAGD